MVLAGSDGVKADNNNVDTKSTITCNEGSSNSIGDLLPDNVLSSSGNANIVTLDDLLQQLCRELQSDLYIGDLNTILSLNHLQLKEGQQVRCIGFDSSIEPTTKSQRFFQYQIIEFKSQTDILSITKQFDDFSQLILGRGRDTPCVIHECCFGLILASIYLIKYQMFSLPQASDIIGYNDYLPTSMKHSHFQKVDSCSLIGDVTAYYYRNMTKRRIATPQKTADQQPQTQTQTPKKKSLLQKLFSSNSSTASSNKNDKDKDKDGAGSDKDKDDHHEEGDLPKQDKNTKKMPNVIAANFDALPDQYKEIIKKWNIKPESIAANWELTLNLLYFQTKVKFFSSREQESEVNSSKDAKEKKEKAAAASASDQVAPPAAPPVVVVAATTSTSSMGNSTSSNTSSTSSTPQQQTTPQPSPELSGTTSTSGGSSKDLGKDGKKKESSSRSRTVPLDKRIASIVPTPYVKKSPDQLIKRSSSEFRKTFTMKERVGKGGFGSVYAAKNNVSKLKVALKKLPHDTQKNKKFNYKEIRVLDFCKHPNIITYHDTYIFGDKAYIAMDFMEGGTLSEASYQYPFQETNIAYVAQEILLGILYLHTNQMVHRDLKSQNIMMTTTGDIKIIDFGLTTSLSKKNYRVRMCGSPLWMPPEMIQQRPHTYSADIWSLAVCLLELANRNQKLRKDPIRTMFMVATEGIKEPFEDPNQWSDTFQDFISQCLRFNPAERPSAMDMLRHPFIKMADSKKRMGKILSSIFLKNIVGI
ncbi:hypothetical protein SAMD00019534_063130 [Acytostelium subglobosum LB1]|uniref:hypothetical protein n=1 Tax=Acytostelium subglobosum LB1 TaxID=1410327 RepID=UPI0006447CC8|nr:hypothetical protein SAMD00019534_063130 [Acytostelium subglobosum LB1]GAM23138.1 hypothetical protein SAMD00019534_063130 [Acytostelium subglobosum LB1]|eukprot:XP_012753587.1 hypothetical protein SAMD00019534_063130 [Acytostelium subglobosum LB1]